MQEDGRLPAGGWKVACESVGCGLQEAGRVACSRMVGSLQEGWKVACRSVGDGLQKGGRVACKRMVSSLQEGGRWPAGVLDVASRRLGG